MTTRRASLGLLGIVMSAAGCTSPLPTSPAATESPTAVTTRSPVTASAPAAGPSASPATTAETLRPTAPPELAGRLAYSLNGDVFVVDLPTGTPLRLTNDAADEFDPDISPDGTRVAYRMASGQGDEADIWLVDADGSNRRNLTDDAALENWAPAWSPDGSRICFNSTRDGTVNRIWTMDPDGGVLTRITDDWGEYCDWSPDGQRIVYVSPGEDGSYDVRVTEVTDPAPMSFSEMDGTEFFPAWSPDGEWIALEHLDSGVWIIRTDGSEPRFFGEGGSIVWSPESMLALDRPGGPALIDVDAGSVAPLSVPFGQFPSWAG